MRQPENLPTSTLSRHPRSERPTRTRARVTHGFTLVELSIAIVVVGILASIGYVSYSSLVDRARLVQAVGDLKAISVAVDNYYVLNKVYPGSLASVGMDGRQDPWNTAYNYLRIADPAGGPRTDSNGDPINTDYELYSNGEDGATSAPLNAANSEDDVVRAGNGGFLGRASNFGEPVDPD